MVKILTILMGLGLIVFIVVADEVTLMWAMSNIMWLLVVAILAGALVVLMIKALQMRTHNITIIDNRQWNTDNSTHTTTSQSYFDNRGMGQLENPSAFLGAPRD